MKDGCKNKPEDCENSHVPDFANYLSYDGPINWVKWLCLATKIKATTIFPFIHIISNF